MNNRLHIGFVYWQPNSEITSLMKNTFQRMGCETIQIFAHAKLPPDLDVVLASGPYGSLAPITNQLAAIPPSQRPLFVIWMTEQLPDPRIPQWILHPFGIMRSWAEQNAYREHLDGSWKPEKKYALLTAKFHRFAYYGDIYRFQKKHILSVLAVGSYWISDYLKSRGIRATVAFIGSNPSWGGNINLERDIPVLWLGKMATDRRQHLLESVQADLKVRRVDTLVVDGVVHPYVFGPERTRMLNRTKIVLNLLREEWDNHSLRFFLAAQNRVLVVSEPVYNHIPFIPGVHYVEAHAENMADVICYYLTHEEERRQIAENAHQLVVNELTMENSAEKILEEIHAIRGEPLKIGT